MEMKSLFTLVSAAILAMGLTACGDNSAPKQDEAKPEAAVEQTQAQPAADTEQKTEEKAAE
jgi:uncharacterized lipoprotein YehR (DUF1307 family)